MQQRRGRVPPALRLLLAACLFAFAVQLRPGGCTSSTAYSQPPSVRAPPEVKRPGSAAALAEAGRTSAAVTAASPSVLQEAVSSDLAARPVGEVSRIFHTLAALRATHQEQGRLEAVLPRVFSALEGRSAEMDTSAVADALWSVATLRKEAPLLLMLLPGLMRRLIARGALLSSREAAMTIWAVVELRQELPHSSLMAEQLAKRLVEDYDDLPGAELSQVMQAVSILTPTSEDILQPCVNYLVEQVQKSASQLTVEQAATILISASELQSKAPRVRELLPMLTPVIAEEAAGMPGASLAAAFEASAALDLPLVNLTLEDGEILRNLLQQQEDSHAGEISVELLQQSRSSLLRAAPRLKIADVSRLLRALASLQQADEEELISALAARFESLGMKISMVAFAQHSPQVLWSLAKLGHLKGKMLALVAKRFAQGMDAQGDVRLLSTAHVRSLAWVLQDVVARNQDLETSLEVSPEDAANISRLHRSLRELLQVNFRNGHLQLHNNKRGSLPVRRALKSLLLAGELAGPLVKLRMDDFLFAKEKPEAVEAAIKELAEMMDPDVPVDKWYTWQQLAGARDFGDYGDEM
eukprot:CAMPEP_0178371460 /NCGR_PEP_ID=MMETSP0689_2-20121128/838_1 /TAXON_ID=160604 /ORGANISM="Amphidinium massartii, Strain CS-259" /LENGTH=583 /DNA_ID=CAMNT_0019991331 /DNA_START=56 /DNA_END=1807 /DNA_ORIENTATION=+